MKRIVKSKLDQFYTKKDVVLNILKNIDLSQYDLIVDPSAGDGAFYSRIDHPNKIAFDIDPQADNIVKCDFLNYNLTTHINKDKVLSLTNPPFGKQGSLALKFMKKCAEFSNTIAFILPLSFVKDSLQSRVMSDFHLVYEEILNEDSFLLENNSYNVKTVFQIWKNLGYPRDKKIIESPVGFEYIDNDENCDISVRRVGVYAGRAYLDKNKSKESHYYIKFNNEINIEDILSKLNLKEWGSTFTVGPKSLPKGDLTPFLNDLLKNVDNNVSVVEYLTNTFNSKEDALKLLRTHLVMLNDELVDERSYITKETSLNCSIKILRK